MYRDAVERYTRAFAGETSLTEVVAYGRVVSTHYVPLRNEKGDVTAAMAICQDVTADRLAQEEIRQLNEQLELRVKDRTIRLEAANSELEAFADSVSHDLRSPLRGIDGWSAALQEDFGAAIGEKGSQFLSRIRSEAQRMGALIDGLLDLSRLTRAEIRWMPVDLTALAHRHAALLREANPDRRIVFRVDPGMEAHGDPRLLEAAIGNLMENAVKFTRPREEATIEVGERRDGAGLREESEFYVRDNGVGFEMAHSRQLFNAFQRLHKASEFPGSGIGLATVHRVIQRHGGRVWADARKGEGATFRFTLASLDRATSRNRTTGGTAR
jgi:signal transduction histidine kinase